ncbi:MAG: hypothetical protein M1541_14185 [Acidobacteria bacterium]|nr:hypothetical protein [Acidobacteriota bacterium]
MPFAVLDAKHQLTPFLQSHGLRYSAFTGAENLPVIVADGAPFARVSDYVAGGGTAVFLNVSSTQLSAFQARLRPARGNWDPVNHGVRPHPIFDGLPAGDFMGQTYLNVCANETIQGIAEPPVVGSLSFDFGQGTMERNYTGPKDAWWGSDMVVVPQGKGRVLLSTLHITENLGKDPVADKLLYNIVRWAAAPGN